MRIISKKDDYYDYVGYVGGYTNDPHAIVYNRDCELVSPAELDVADIFYGRSRSGVPLKLLQWSNLHGLFEVGAVIVGEYEFPFVRMQKPFGLDDYYDRPIILCPSNEKLLLAQLEIAAKHSGDRFVRMYSSNSYTMERVINLLHEQTNFHHGDQIHKLLRQVNAPVFTLFYAPRTNSRVYVDETVPILADYKISKYLSPEQCYQTIEHALCNIINTNPDKAKPVTMPDKAKILSHGFDFVASFRHRK